MVSTAVLLIAWPVVLLVAIVVGPWSSKAVWTRIFDRAGSEGQEKPALIASGLSSHDLSWMESFSSEYELYPYRVDNTSMPSHLRVPMNKGNEAMVYLSWIIDNYDHLPPFATFVHGHFTAWHQEKNISSLVSSLKLDALQQLGYVSLRCEWWPGCPDEMKPLARNGFIWGGGHYQKETEDVLAEVWQIFFPAVQVPETIASQCCAQFAVTRAAIRSRPHFQWLRMREWLINTPLIDQISGLVFEKLWAYIFTNRTIVCPSPQECSCKYFGHCSSRDWVQPPHGSGIELPEDSRKGFTLPEEAQFPVDLQRSAHETRSLFEFSSKISKMDAAPTKPPNSAN